MEIKVKKLYDKAVLPTKGSEHSAGFDLYACSTESPSDRDVVLPGETVKYKTGVAVQIPEGYFGAVFARSGLATKNGLRPANCVGVIDSDYTGEIIVPIFNDSPYEQHVHYAQRIAQLVIIPYLDSQMVEVDELTETERGSGGFGSTGS